MNNRQEIRDIMIFVNSIYQTYTEIAKKLIIKEDLLSLLYALDDGKCHTQSDICKSWNIPKTTINTIVQECKKQNLLTLEESQTNKKEKYLKITEYGKIYSNEILSAIYEIENKAYEQCKNSSNYLDFLQTFAKSLDNETNNYFTELYQVRMRNELESTEYNDSFYNQLKKLYQEAFPKSEQVPLDDLLNHQLGDIKTYIFTYKNSFVGFCSTLAYKNIVYLLYFAMSSKYRNRGFGSQAIELIKRKYENKVILADIEKENYNSQNNLQRIKRKKFYLRSGFLETNITYIQSNTEFMILNYGESISEQEINEFWQNVPKKLMQYYRK